jgi:hypothetical protein
LFAGRSHFRFALSGHNMAPCNATGINPSSLLFRGRDIEDRRVRLDGAELIERARSGHRDAYEQPDRRHRELAFLSAYVITKSASDAEDAAWERFGQGFVELGTVRPACDRHRWMTGTITVVE